MATLGFVALTLALGNWQRQRAADKEALAAQFAAAAGSPPIELDATQPDFSRLRFRRKSTA